MSTDDINTYKYTTIYKVKKWLSVFAKPDTKSLIGHCTMTFDGLGLQLLYQNALQVLLSISTIANYLYSYVLQKKHPDVLRIMSFKMTSINIVISHKLQGQNNTKIRKVVCKKTLK